MRANVFYQTAESAVLPVNHQQPRLQLNAAPGCRMTPACNTISKRICQEGHANALALNKDCNQIAVAGRSLLKVYTIEPDGFLEVCNMRGDKNKNLSYSSNDVAWSTIDSNLLATAATNGVISVWDLSKYNRQKQVYMYNEHERTAHTVTFHHTEPNWLVSGSQDGTIKLFDLRTDKAVSTYQSNAESVRDVKFSPQQPSQFAAVSENGTVQLWDLKRPDRSMLQFTAHSGPVYTCDWHPTQPWLATGSRDRQIKVWRMDQRPSLEFNIHTIAVVGRVKWRPDRQFHIASCALVVDYSIYIWDVRRPYLPYASFTEHTNVTTGIAFKGSDPHVLMSASKDSTIFKHSFHDANRPTTTTNPQATNFSLNGDLMFSFKLKVSPSAAKSAARNGNGLKVMTPTTPGTPVAAAAAAPQTPRSSGPGAFIADTISSVYSTPRSQTPGTPGGSAAAAAGQSAAAAAAAAASASAAVCALTSAGAAVVDQFHMAKSCLLSYTTTNSKAGGGGCGGGAGGKQGFAMPGSAARATDYDTFRGCAREYILAGAYLPDVCEYNAAIARKFGKANVSMLWRFVGNQYAAVPQRVGALVGGAELGPRKSIVSLQKMLPMHQLQVGGGGGVGGAGGGGSLNKSGSSAASADADEQERLEDLSAPPEYGRGSAGVTGGGGAGGGIAQGAAVSAADAASFAAASKKLAQTIESLGSHMHGEAEELSVRDVKGLRDGFLYVGPHDTTRGWSLPHNNLDELQTRKARQDREAESRQLAREEGVAPPEPLGLITITRKHAASFAWQPHDVLADGLQLQVDIGDVQTAICILIVMGDRRAALPIDDLTYEAWLLAYIELLQRHQLWVEATEIVNHSWIWSVREINQQSTLMHTSCGDCGRQLNSAGSGWFCSRCKSARATSCSVCNRPVHGLYAWCQGCAHGGHLEHIRSWFSDHSKCAKCGHMCEYD